MLLLEELDAGLRRRLQQRPLHLAPGEVGGVHDAALRVSALARQVIAERCRVLGEFGAELDQLAHPRRALGDGDADGVLAAQTRAGHQRVADVLVEAVLRAEDGRDPTLGVGGVRLATAPLGDHGDGPMPGRLEGEREAGDAAAENQVVKLVTHVGT